MAITSAQCPHGLNAEALAIFFLLWASLTSLFFGATPDPSPPYPASHSVEVPLFKTPQPEPMPRLRSAMGEGGGLKGDFNRMRSWSIAFCGEGYSRRLWHGGVSAKSFGILTLSLRKCQNDNLSQTWNRVIDGLSIPPQSKVQNYLSA